MQVVCAVKEDEDLYEEEDDRDDPRAPGVYDEERVGEEERDED